MSEAIKARCDFEFAETLPDGRYKLVCRECGRSKVSQYAEPKFNLRICRAARAIGSPGVGDEFKRLTDSFGLLTRCGGCLALLADMNRWGPDGCEEHLAEILARLDENESKLGWGEWLKAGSRAMLSGYLNKADVLDEAIRRARKAESPTTAV